MNKISNINLAYEFLKKAKKGVPLMTVWNGIKKDITNNKADDSETIADLYGEMVLDNRFALSKTGEWSVADGKKVENIKTELKTKTTTPKSKKGEDLVYAIEDEDEDPEIYDEFFIEDEEDETSQIFYDEDDD